MKILYLSSLISKNLYDNLYKKNKPGTQVQVFNQNIVNGLLENNYKVTCLSNIPISKFLTNKLFINVKEKNMIYTPTINIPIIKDLIVIIYSFFKTLFYILKHRNVVCISDILSTTNSLGALFACKILKKQFIGIVTDIPEFISNDKLFLRLSKIILNNCTDYIFLTQLMNEYINKKNKPYKIIEGMCKAYKEIQTNKINAFMYAGSLDKTNGIDTLINTFKHLQYKLHIYGDGDYLKEILNSTKTHDNIKYFGLIPHHEILEKIQQVKFLINPRDINNIMVKYSFPSKTMEYLASGTPFLTTKLPCIPKEYDKYLNYIDQNNMKEDILNILNTNYDLLLDKAKQGKKFVLENKNNKIQTQKIIELIRGK